MKQLRLLPVLITSLCLLATEKSQAARGGGNSGFFLEETFFPVYVNKSDTQSFDPAGTPTEVATESGLGFDFRTTLGYTFSSQLIVGMTYNIYNLTTTRAAVNGGLDGLNEKTQKSEYGPTIGYLSGNWRMLLTYFLAASRQVDYKNTDSSGAITSDTTFKNTEGSGFQFAFGYSYSLGAHFEIGPSLVYRTITYAKQSKVNRLSPAENYEASKLPSKAVDSNLTPMITMQVRF